MASKLSERLALSAGYPAQPGGRTKAAYFVDEALKDARFKVKSALNPSGVKIVHEPGGADPPHGARRCKPRPRSRQRAPLSAPCP
ncbi:hypothetical protein ACWD4G_07570 [Streptomyces sp. NPDC002643]